MIKQLLIAIKILWPVSVDGCLALRCVRLRLIASQVYFKEWSRHHYFITRLLRAAIETDDLKPSSASLCRCCPLYIKAAIKNDSSNPHASLSPLGSYNPFNFLH